MIHKSQIQLPRTLNDQLRLLPARREELEAIARDLELEIRRVLTAAHITIIESSQNTLPSERLAQKIDFFGVDSIKLLHDIHKIRVVVEPKDRESASVAIFANWKTPPVMPWGLPARRDHSDPETKALVNPRSFPHYRALHLTIVIPNGARLADIRIFTPEDVRIERETRPDYDLRKLALFTAAKRV